MGCGTKMVKTLMFVANVLFALAGLALIALAAYVRVEDNDYNSVFGKGGPFAPANIMIAAGVIVFIISFLGCVGAIRQSKCMLIMFIVCIVIVLLCETALIVLAFVYKSEAKKYATDAIVEAIRDTYGESGQSGITTAVNNIQTNFKCCGANNYTDWLGSKWVKANPTLRVPKSCCADTNFASCQNASMPATHIHSKNCVTELTDWAEKNLTMVGGLACGVVVIELLGIIFAAILINKADSVHVM
ncbi:CD151 antigen-like isoform X2 [Rhopilema esculentum]|uniref:CD151 antigen-like isoform X2 n=1 Tax=Rhopilema esculentum TaxID=499914 RepID=UPI0031CF8860